MATHPVQPAGVAGAAKLYSTQEEPIAAPQLPVGGSFSVISPENSVLPQASIVYVMSSFSGTFHGAKRSQQQVGQSHSQHSSPLAIPGSHVVPAPGRG